MDLCHCPVPNVVKTEGHKDAHCTVCGMYYIHEQWLKDPRRATMEERMANTGRNDLCPCMSGKKFKKCCLGKDMTKVERVERQFQASADSSFNHRFSGLTNPMQ